MTIEYKRMNFEYRYNKSDDQNHTVEGKANVFNIVDLKKDIVLPGAMKSTLAQAYARGILPAMLLEHSVDLYAGLWYAVEEQEDSLFVSGKVLADTEGGKQAIQGLYNRTLIGLSIGFEVMSYYIKDGIRYIQELDLYEVSMVSHPANTQALITKFIRS